MRIKFSIIIPVFNASMHLRECLDSVLAQSMAEWECICVNDGSSDDSVQILNHYAKADRRFRVIDMKSNVGVSAARNAGLYVAKGEYVGFVDSDDVISPHWLEAAKDAAATTADMVKMPVSRKLPFPDYICSSHVRELSGYDVFDFSILRGGLAVQNFYRRETLNGICFRMGMRVYEDAIFNLDALMNVSKAVQCGFSGYWYRDSVMSAWKLRTSEDIERLIYELVCWYGRARELLRKCSAESLAKDRLAGYVTAIVQDFIGKLDFCAVKGAAQTLPLALQSFEKALGPVLVDKIAVGRLKAIKNYAYSRFIWHGRWLLLWMLLTTIRKLKGMSK